MVGSGVPVAVLDGVVVGSAVPVGVRVPVPVAGGERKKSSWQPVLAFANQTGRRRMGAPMCPAPSLGSIALQTTGWVGKVLPADSLSTRLVPAAAHHCCVNSAYLRNPSRMPFTARESLAR